jgi:hypothetical protein
MINIHVHLPEKYRSIFLHGVFLFLKVWVSNCKLWFLFRSCLLKLHLVFLTSENGMTSTYFFTYKLLSQGLLALPYIFYCFRKEIIEPTLFCVFGLPPNLIMPPSVQFGFFFWDEAMWKKIWLFKRSCFHVEVLEFQSYSKHINHFNIDLKQTRYEEIQVIPMDKLS